MEKPTQTLSNFEEIDFSKWDQCAACLHREVCRGGLRNGEVCNEKEIKSL